MFQRYTVERDRLRVLGRYDAVITHSRHMETEYYRHGLAPERLHGLPYEVTDSSAPAQPLEPRQPVEPCTRLLFVGRMERLKGGQIFLDALPAVQQALQRPIEVHFAGDGLEREHWQALADRVMGGHPQISIRFHGWTTGTALQDLFRGAHLLVVPSLWPEPFGKVGPEAAIYGLPVAAFAVGGIEEWLMPGVNGMLAPGNPPTASGLAAAIVACTLDSAVHAELCAGALANMNRFNLQTHVDALIALFRKVSEERTAMPAAVSAL